MDFNEQVKAMNDFYNKSGKIAKELRNGKYRELNALEAKYKKDAQEVVNHYDALGQQLYTQLNYEYKDSLPEIVKLYREYQSHSNWTAILMLLIAFYIPIGFVFFLEYNNAVNEPLNIPFLTKYCIVLGIATIFVVRKFVKVTTLVNKVDKIKKSL